MTISRRTPVGALDRPSTALARWTRVRSSPVDDRPDDRALAPTTRLAGEAVDPSVVEVLALGTGGLHVAAERRAAVIERMAQDLDAGGGERAGAVAGDAPGLGLRVKLGPPQRL